MSFLRPRKRSDDPSGVTAAAESLPQSLRPVAVPPINSAVADALTAAAGRGSTGMIEVTDRGGPEAARLFLFEGGLYAVDLDGYEPPVAARLLSSGRIDDRSRGRLAGDGGAHPSAAGVVAVEEGWVPVEVLGTVHQEYVLAGLGAVLALAKARTRFRAGEVTDAFCTVPLRVEPLFATVRLRAERLLRTWAVLEEGGDPATMTLTATGRGGTPSAPEFAAFATACEGGTSLDSAAHAVGFTRAEAVHVAVVLVQAGTVSVSAHAAPPADAGFPGLAVPEAFGTRSAGRARGSAAPSAPRPQPLADPVSREANEPGPVPEPVDEAALAAERRARAARRVAELAEALAQAEAVRDEAQSHVDELRARLSAAELDL